MAELPRGIRKRGNSFQIDVTEGGRRRTASAATFEEAKKKHAELKHALLNGDFDTSDTAKAGRCWTLGEAYDATLAARWKGTRGGHTAEKNASAAVTFYGRSRKLDTIDTEALDAWVADLLKGGNSNGTVNRKLAALSTIMTHAIERKHLPGGKPKFPRRREHKGRIRYLTDGEEATVLRLFGQWDKLDEVDAVTVLIDTGLRTGELYRLKASDCAFPSRMLHVWENKADLPRSVPMTKRVVEVLKRRAITHSGQLFPYHADWLRHVWDKAKATMGLEDDDQFVPHALRHTFASRLVQRNVNLKTVQQLLGHKTLEITMRYAHLAPANLQQAIALLEPAAEKIGV